MKNQKCKRCGKRIQAGNIYCDECFKQVQEEIKNEGKGEGE